MIRRVRKDDAPAIARIYNHYVADTDISFETEPVSDSDMLARIEAISARFPYLVCEIDGEVAGYCYVHQWKERAAYCHTLETTVYLAPDRTGAGIGRSLMMRLIEECRMTDCHALVACITGGNEPSCRLHENLGFSRVSHFLRVGRKHGKWLDVVDYELLL